METLNAPSSFIIGQLKNAGMLAWSRLPSEEVKTSAPTIYPDTPRIRPGQGSTLYALPIEIRAQIFEELLCDWNGRTPKLLRALKLDTQLYSEALDTFYRINRIIVHLRTWNGWSFQHLSKTGARAIRQVHIQFG
jgi:hypothetical protein